jgi:hypothetical protein
VAMVCTADQDRLERRYFVLAWGALRESVVVAQDLHHALKMRVWYLVPE